MALFEPKFPVRGESKTSTEKPDVDGVKDESSWQHDINKARQKLESLKKKIAFDQATIVPAAGRFIIVFTAADDCQEKVVYVDPGLGCFNCSSNESGCDENSQSDCFPIHSINGFGYIVSCETCGKLGFAPKSDQFDEYMCFRKGSLKTISVKGCPDCAEIPALDIVSPSRVLMITEVVRDL